MHNSLKDKVLESIDIIDVVGERVALVKKGKDFVGLCPFHNDHKPSMTVSQAKQIFKCWSCGAGGDVIKFVQLRERLEFRDALALLAERAGIRLDSAGEAAAGPDRQALRAALVWAKSHFQRNLTQTPAGRSAFDYARSRGMSEPTIDRFSLGFAADSWTQLCEAGGRSGLAVDVMVQAGLAVPRQENGAYDRFRNRLMFPIADAQARTIALGGRALGDDPAKYLNSPETALFSKSRVLYAYEFARAAIAKDKCAIVVEGYIDAVLLHQAGFENVVATLGTALTDAHVKALSADCEKIVMCFDGDEAGTKAADRAVQVALTRGQDVRVVVMPPGEDPADVVVKKGADEFNSLLQSAIGALEFKWNRTLQAFGAGPGRSKREAIEAYLGFIGRMVGQGGIGILDLGLAVSRISEIIGLPAAAIYEAVERGQRTAGPHPDAVSAANSAAAAIEIRADYDEAILDLPPRLVGAVETLIGVVLSVGRLDDRFDAGLAQVAGHCSTWNRMLGLLRESAESGSPISASSILERTDDPVLCDLLTRAMKRVGQADPLAAGDAAVDRIRSELEQIRIHALRDRLAASEAREPADRDRALRALIDLGKNSHGPLGSFRRAPITAAKKV